LCILLVYFLSSLLKLHGKKIQLEIDFTVRSSSHICFHILGWRLKSEKVVVRNSSVNLGRPYACPRDAETISVGINWTELSFRQSLSTMLRKKARDRNRIPQYSKRGQGYSQCNRKTKSLRSWWKLSKVMSWESGDWIPVGATIFAPVQTNPGVHTASCTLAHPVFFPLGVKRGDEHPPPIWRWG